MKLKKAKTFNEFALMKINNASQFCKINIYPASIEKTAEEISNKGFAIQNFVEEYKRDIDISTKELINNIQPILQKLNKSLKRTTRSELKYCICEITERNIVEDIDTFGCTQENGKKKIILFRKFCDRRMYSMQ